MDRNIPELKLHDWRTSVALTSDSHDWEEIPQPTQQITEGKSESTKEEEDESTQFSLDSF